MAGCIRPEPLPGVHAAVGGLPARTLGRTHQLSPPGGLSSMCFCCSLIVYGKVYWTNTHRPPGQQELPVAHNLQGFLRLLLVAQLLLAQLLLAAHRSPREGGLKIGNGAGRGWVKLLRIRTRNSKIKSAPEPKPHFGWNSTPAFETRGQLKPDETLEIRATVT